MTSLSQIKTIIKKHAVTGKTDDSFVGIKIRNDIVHIYYPESYRISDENFSHDVLDLLKTISIAKTNSNDRGKIESSLSKNDSFALVSYLWIINDFLYNGIYTNREKVYKLNQTGRIDWKRTLKNQPIISKSNVIYKDITVEVSNKMDNLIVEIHKFCVNKCLEYIGWLYNLKSTIVYAKPINETLKKLYINTVKKELDNTFDDNKKLRFNHMLKVLSGVDMESKNDEFIYGVDSYYYIFERMVDSIFSSRDDIKEFNPRANWFLKKNNYKKIKSSNLRPDTILIDKDILYILDSKFYRFGFTCDEKDLPETTSIQKQITYGEYIEKLKYEGIKDIRNAFILPYDKLNNKFGYSNILEYIGYATSEWKDNDKNHEVIHAFLIDLSHVIKTYNKMHHEFEIDSLVRNIEENTILLKKRCNYD